VWDCLIQEDGATGKDEALWSLVFSEPSGGQRMAFGHLMSNGLYVEKALQL